MMKPAKPYADVVIIVPLLEEFQRLERMFGVAEQVVHGTNVVSKLDTGPVALSVVAVLQEAMGKTAALAATDLATSVYEIGVIAVLGIAGGLSGDVAIGDRMHQRNNHRYFG